MGNYREIVQNVLIYSFFFVWECDMCILSDSSLYKCQEKFGCASKDDSCMLMNCEHEIIASVNCRADNNCDGKLF